MYPCFHFVRTGTGGKGILFFSSLKIEIRFGAFKNIFFPLLIKVLTFGNNSLTFSEIRLQA